jgi:hypothetical protein
MSCQENPENLQLIENSGEHALVLDVQKHGCTSVKAISRNKNSTNQHNTKFIKRNKIHHKLLE